MTRASTCRLAAAMLSVLAGFSFLATPSALAQVPAAASASPSPSNSSTGLVTIDANTVPSEERKIAFAGQGIVKDVMVKEGDPITVGQVIAKQDDEADQAELKRLEIDANSMSRVEAAEADKKAKTAKYNRLRQAQLKGASNAGEVEEAENDMIRAEKQLAVSHEELDQAKIKYQIQQIKCDRMQLKSPVNGFVQKLVLGAGEYSDPQRQEGAAYVVQNDPLKIVVTKFTTLQVSTLKNGEKLEVRYLNDKEEKWLPAEITYIAPYADGGTNMHFIHLSLPNPDNRPAGQPVAIKLPQKLIDTAPKDPFNTALSSNP
jgi:HlyD family secretion protein